MHRAPHIICTERNSFVDRRGKETSIKYKVEAYLMLNYVIIVLDMYICDGGGDLH